jgi:putative ABC transport system permease protein
LGNADQVLQEKNSIVISGHLAQTLFGSAEASIGKTIDWDFLDTKKSVVVSGVFDKIPENSSMKFDYVMTYELLVKEVVPGFDMWNNEGPSTYLLLKEGTDIEKLNAKIAGYLKGYNKGSIFSLFVRPYSSAYLYGHYENGKQAGGRIEYVKLFSLVALFILVIACINFMNLSTAKASRRMKEVGVKKVVGSSRRALILQFLSEAVFMALLSVIVASFLVAALMPVFNEFTGKQLEMTWSPKIIGALLGVAILTGLLSGSYPAFYLSRFSPVAVLKGKMKSSLGELLARKGLVVFQFSISLVLIIAVMVIYQQVEYVQSKHLGYEKENVIIFDKEGMSTQNTETFLNELRKQPGIVKASAIQQGIVEAAGNIGAATYGIEWPGKTEKDLVNFNMRSVDHELIETLGIKVKEGRSFSRDFGAEERGLIFNEAAIRAMGLENPIGTKVKLWGEEKTIIGVVKDFHLSSLHERIEPMVFRFNPRETWTIVAKLESGKEKQTLGSLESFYKKINPGFAFQYSFLDDTYQAQYVSEQRVSVLSRCFAGLAILISCLGLFGLAAFNAEIRTKEIGIRKVLGASVENVVTMLSKDFMQLIGIAIVIAFPLAWWAMNTWLEGFAYHITIGPWIFLVAGLALILIALLTLSYQSIKTALMNPAKSLRSE